MINSFLSSYLYAHRIMCFHPSAENCLFYSRWWQIETQTSYCEENKSVECWDLNGQLDHTHTELKDHDKRGKGVIVRGKIVTALLHMDTQYCYCLNKTCTRLNQHTSLHGRETGSCCPTLIGGTAGSWWLLWERKPIFFTDVGFHRLRILDRRSYRQQ